MMDIDQQIYVEWRMLRGVGGITLNRLKDKLSYTASPSILNISGTTRLRFSYLTIHYSKLFNHSKIISESPS